MTYNYTRYPDWYVAQQTGIRGGQQTAWAAANDIYGSQQTLRDQAYSAGAGRPGTPYEPSPVPKPVARRRVGASIREKKSAFAKRQTLLEAGELGKGSEVDVDAYLFDASTPRVAELPPSVAQLFEKKVSPKHVERNVRWTWVPITLAKRLPLVAVIMPSPLADGTLQPGQLDYFERQQLPHTFEVGINAVEPYLLPGSQIPSKTRYVPGRIELKPDGTSLEWQPNTVRAPVRYRGSTKHDQGYPTPTEVPNIVRPPLYAAQTYLPSDLLSRVIELDPVIPTVGRITTKARTDLRFDFKMEPYPHVKVQRVYGKRVQQRASRDMKTSGGAISFAVGKVALDGFGTTSEIMDFVDAVRWNIYFSGTQIPALTRGVDGEGLIRGIITGQLELDARGAVVSYALSLLGDRIIGFMARGAQKNLNALGWNDRLGWQEKDFTLNLGMGF